MSILLATIDSIEPIEYICLMFFCYSDSCIMYDEWLFCKFYRYGSSNSIVFYSIFDEIMNEYRSMFWGYYEVHISEGFYINFNRLFFYPFCKHLHLFRKNIPHIARYILRSFSQAWEFHKCGDQIICMLDSFLCLMNFLISFLCFTQELQIPICYSKRSLEFMSCIMNEGLHFIDIFAYRSEYSSNERWTYEGKWQHKDKIH